MMLPAGPQRPVHLPSSVTKHVLPLCLVLSKWQWSILSPCPSVLTPVMQRGTPTNRSNHTSHFPGGYDLFYIIDVTGNRAKIPPPGSKRRNNQENYLHQRSGAESGRGLPGSGWNSTGSGHGSQADLVVAPIEDGEILADEDITQDPEVPRGGGDVHALEPAGADPVALEERRIKPELGLRPFGDRRWGLSIQDHGALPATCKEELPGSCLGTWLFLAWGSASVSNSLLSWFPGITRHYPVFLADVHTLTSASELRGLGRTQLPGRILEALVTQPFLIILIPTSGKLDQLLVLFIH